MSSKYSGESSPSATEVIHYLLKGTDHAFCIQGCIRGCYADVGTTSSKPEAGGDKPHLTAGRALCAAMLS